MTRRGLPPGTVCTDPVPEYHPPLVSSSEGPTGFTARWTTAPPPTPTNHENVHVKNATLYCFTYGGSPWTTPGKPPAGASPTPPRSRPQSPSPDGPSLSTSGHGVRRRLRQPSRGQRSQTRPVFRNCPTRGLAQGSGVPTLYPPLESILQGISSLSARTRFPPPGTQSSRFRYRIPKPVALYSVSRNVPTTHPKGSQP